MSEPELGARVPGARRHSRADRNPVVSIAAYAPDAMSWPNIEAFYRDDERRRPLVHGGKASHEDLSTDARDLDAGERWLISCVLTTLEVYAWRTDVNAERVQPRSCSSG